VNESIFTENLAVHALILILHCFSKRCKKMEHRQSPLCLDELTHRMDSIPNCIIGVLIKLWALTCTRKSARSQRCLRCLLLQILTCRPPFAQTETWSELISSCFQPWELFSVSSGGVSAVHGGWHRHERDPPYLFWKWRAKLPLLCWIPHWPVSSSDTPR